jgi:type VI secretion system protein ImpJ
MEKEYRELFWSEGMFMQPHHFQFATRNADTKLRQAVEHVVPFNWGFKHLEIDTASLKNDFFAVQSCQIILENGTQLKMPGNLDLDSRSFKDDPAGSTEFLDVFVGIPSWRPDSPNIVGEEEERGMLERRYRVDETDIADENSGQNQRPLQIKRYRGRILWATEDRAGYDTIQIARVKMSPSGETTGLDPNYIPPVPDIRAWPPLLAICSDISNGLSMANAALVRDFADRDFTELLGVPRGLEAIIKMMATNSHVACLEQLCNTPNLHPYLIYLELLRLAAILGVFKGKRTVPTFSNYRHDDLGRCFLEIKEVIDGLMDRIGTSTFFQRSFQFRNERLEVDLENDWVSGNRLLYIGVSGEESLERLDRNISRLKLCAPNDLAAVTQKRLAGVGMQRLRRVPATLPERAGMFYFQLNMEGNFWQGIEQDKIMAIAGSKDMDYSFILYVV